jgi:hypothetical protein
LKGRYVLVFRYLVVVGVALLGMLFFADWCLPSPPQDQSRDSSMDKTIVRIRSADRWPAKVVIDTTIPTIVPPAASAAAAVAPTPPPRNATAEARLQDIPAPKPKQQARVHHRLARTAPPMRFAVNPVPSWPSGWW